MTISLPQDFGDWISPILVKELRQGLRTRVFTLIFITLQTVLLLFMLAGMREGADEEFITGTFWFLLFLILLVLTPLRGMHALSSEVKQNTLDLLSLTRLNAFRICFGKWAALFTQALLFAVAVLPYVVLRYFSGGVDLVLELALLALGLMGSAVLCAFSIALSSLANAQIRTILIIGFIFLIFTGTGPLWFTSRLGTAGVLPAANWWAWAGLLALAAFLTFYCISAAATRISTDAENYSGPRRLCALAGIALALVLALTWKEGFMATAYVFLSLLAADSLTEHSSQLPSVHRPFLRLGWAGRFPQLLLTPGWHSGALLICLLLAIFGVVFARVDGSGHHAGLAAVHLSLAGCLLLPVLLTELIWRNPPDRFAPYFFIQMAHLALGGFFIMLGKGAKAPILLWAGSALPSTSLFMALPGDHDRDVILLSISTVSFLAIGAALLFLGRRYWLAILGMRKTPGSHNVARSG